MPSLGPAEILVILVVALLVFGPNKMPEMARQAGRAFREFRRVQQHLRSEISGAMSDLDVNAMGNPASTAAPEASDMMGGGDPVPMLPPKDEPPEGPRSSGPPPADPA
jgi:sec-independent protein translocase protein TatA